MRNCSKNLYENFCRAVGTGTIYFGLHNKSDNYICHPKIITKTKVCEKLKKF